MGGYEEYGYDKSEGEVLRETEKAILFQEDEGLDREKKPYWVPKSQIHDNSEVWQKGQVGMLVVKEWFARQKGWIDGRKREKKTGQRSFKFTKL
jgi:hypothetical protein